MTTSDDYQRLARRAARLATYRESEERYRREIAVGPGQVPTLEQLFSGAQPLNGSVDDDAKRWASDLLQTSNGQQLSGALFDALLRFASDPSPRTAEEVETLALAEASTFNPLITIEDLCGEIADRVTLYGAMMGDPHAASRAVALLSDTLISYVHLAHTDPVAVREIAVTMMQMAALCQRDIVPPLDLGLFPSWSLTRSTARRMLETLAIVTFPPEELLRAAGPAGDEYTDARVIPDPDDRPVMGFTDARNPTRVVLPAALEKKRPSGSAKPLIGLALPCIGCRTSRHSASAWSRGGLGSCPRSLGSWA